MDIPKIIHFTIPRHPSDDQLKNIQIARDSHPDWQIVVWQDPIDRADFTLAKYWDKANSGAQLADLIRLEVVYKQGGFYLDSDFVIHRSLDPLRAYSFVVASEDGQTLTNAFFGAVPQSPALKLLIDELDRHEPDWTLPPVFTTGPSLFAQQLKWRKDVTVIPRESFYPYNWNKRECPPRLWTYASHLWDHSWEPDRNQSRWQKFYTTLKARVLGIYPFVRRRAIARYRSLLFKFRNTMHVDPPRPYSASGVICAQTMHGPKILLIGDDVTVTPEIALRGTYEFLEERFVQRVVRPGDWVIDVGANVGLFSLLFAQRVGPFGRVFSYEPNPLPAELLKQSLLMNWCHERVEVRQKAIGSETGVLSLRYNRAGLGGATLAEQGSAGTMDDTAELLAGHDSIDVAVSTLDQEFPVDLPIRLLKVDVEGFEHHVLRGAARLLERHCVDILMLECIQEVYGDQWGEYLLELKKLISQGYALYTLTSASKLRPLSLEQLLYHGRIRNIFLVAGHATKTILELC